MKKSRLVFLSIVLLAIVLLFSVQAQAGLQTIGTATYGGSDYNLIYDNDSQLTWLDYTNNNAVWPNQNSWALGLNGAGELTYNLNAGMTMNWTDDWHLPTTYDQNCSGYNCTNSDFGSLYYTALGNTAGNFTNSGDFQNLQGNNYWSTEYPALNAAWLFRTYNGEQNFFSQGSGAYGIAVRTGMAVVPEPISSTLFIVGGATLGFRRFRKKLKK